jgi:HEAT repeat protein
MASLRDRLDALFDAERRARELHAELVDAPHAELVPELSEAARTALTAGDDEDAAVRLVRIALLLGDLEGDTVVDLLIDILGSEAPEARIAAGEALEALAFERFKEVALGIERAVTRLPKGSPALTELPFLLAEVGEPGCVKLIGQFLKHDDPEAVAAAIEALAELGDPSAAPLLAPLERDARQVQLDDEDGEADRVAIGELAHEARELLEEVAKNAQGGGKGEPHKKGKK